MWIVGRRHESTPEPTPPIEVEADDLTARYEKEDRMLAEIDRQFMRAREALRLAERRSQERH